MTWTSSDTSQTGDMLGQRPLKRETPVAGDSWAALDVSVIAVAMCRSAKRFLTFAQFILALEWPCRDHIKHAGINPVANVPNACNAGGNIHGHSLTTTSAVYQSAVPPSNVLPSQNGLHPDTMNHWQLPHSEIDK
jgi:hypothetical protein